MMSISHPFQISYFECPKPRQLTSNFCTLTSFATASSAGSDCCELTTEQQAASEAGADQ